MPFYNEVHPPAPHEVAKTEEDTAHADNHPLTGTPHAKEHRRVL